MRRGIALLLVLILISVGAAVTLQFLQSASDGSVLTQSLVDSKKAEFLAESGLAEACYWLRHPELTAGTAWAGVLGRQVGGSTDYYNVTVTPKATDPSCYVVGSEGHLMDGAAERMTHAVSGDFRMYYGFAEGITASCDLIVPANATVTGDVYSAGALSNNGHIDGSVWVSGSYTNTGTISGLTNLACAVRDIGSYPAAEAATYTVGGIVYPAESILLDAVSDQTWSENIANPMGVYSRGGDLRLGGVTTVAGTLAVTGNLTLTTGSTTTITAKPNFPALVVQGNLVLEGDTIGSTINGAVIVYGRIQSTGSGTASYLTINGPLVFAGAAGGFDAAFSTTPIVSIAHDPARADVSGLYMAQARTLAGAKLIHYRADGS